MITASKKRLALLGLLASAIITPLIASVGYNINSNQVYTNNNVVVPQSATCQQYGAVYSPLPHFMTNNGPLGNYTRYEGNSLYVSGSIGAGTYAVRLEV